MDLTITTSWWDCPGCGVEMELPDRSTSGCLVPCPDCGAAMTEQWRWDTAA